MKRHKYLIIIAMFSIVCFTLLLLNRSNYIYIGLGTPVYSQKYNCDLGILPTGDDVLRVLNLNNKSSQAIHIKKIVPSCPCIEVLPSSLEIPPRGSIDISCNYQTHGYTGDNTQLITVFFENEKITPVTFSRNAYFYTKKLILSNSLIDFGEVCIGKSVAEKVQIQNVDYPNGVWEIKEIASDNENITINWEPDNIYFTCKLLSEEIGSVTGNVTVTTTKGTEESKTLLPIKGEIVGKIIAEPRQLFLGQQQAASEIEKVVKLKPLVDTIPQDIKLAVAVPNGGKWEITEQNEKEIDISVSFPTPQKKGLYNDTIIVTIETDSKYELRIPVSCNIR